ncbi:hypothetical protein Droror1_Dr00022750 [Drosera rotundifolia]
MVIPLIQRLYGAQICIQTRCWTPCFDRIHASLSAARLVSHSLNHSDGGVSKTRFDFQDARMIGNGGIACVSLGYRFSSVLWYSSRSYRRRENRRIRLRNQPVLDDARFNKAVSELPPRFTAEDLHDAIVLQDDPLICLELFNWASHQPRFRHGVCSFHVTIKKLGAAKMYNEMDDVVNQVLAIRHLGSEALYNTMIYYFTEARKLTRAVYIFKHMKSNKNLECRPSIRTYNLLFTAFLSRRTDTHVNHMYMETMRCLFRQLVDDGLEPDIYALNSMIKGYVLSNHVNDALRLFHQMGVVYTCLPNAVSYDHIIHGLCAQGRTNNARELVKKMKEEGFVLNSRTYNSLVNSLSITGEIEEAVLYLREMSLAGRLIDFITYRTLLDELCRRGDAQKAMKLLLALRKEGIVNELSYNQLLSVLQDDFRWSASENNAVIARL